MIPKFKPERLVNIRENLGLNKSEAARLIGLSPIGYLRYEQGIRTPSIPILQQIALKLQTSVRYLTGVTKDPSPDIIYISKYDEEALFRLISEIRKDDNDDIADELLNYYHDKYTA